MKIMKSIRKLSVILLAAAACAAWPAMAQDSTPPATNTAPAPRPRRAANRFTGIITSIDSANMLLTLKGRTNETKVKITSTTKITKDRQPATFADAVEGLRVIGTGKKGDDNVWTATSVNISTVPPRKPPAATPPAPAPSQ
jgi:hypothetical protein